VIAGKKIVESFVRRHTAVARESHRGRRGIDNGRELAFAALPNQFGMTAADHARARDRNAKVQGTTCSGHGALTCVFSGRRVAPRNRRFKFGSSSNSLAGRSSSMMLLLTAGPVASLSYLFSCPLSFPSTLGAPAELPRRHAGDVFAAELDGATGRLDLAEDVLNSISCPGHWAINAHLSD
jgi:hypothetical protein